MKVRLLAFSHLASRLGFREREVEYSEAETPRQLLQRLHPGFEMENVRVARDEEYAAWDEPIGLARELALIPPVSGG